MCVESYIRAYHHVAFPSPGTSRASIICRAIHRIGTCTGEATPGKIEGKGAKEGPEVLLVMVQTCPLNC